MTKQPTKDEQNPEMIDRHWIVEARDKKGDDWYRFGGKHESLQIAEFYRVGNVLYKARHRIARIVEITTYRKIVQPES